MKDIYFFGGSIMSEESKNQQPHVIKRKNGVDRAISAICYSVIILVAINFVSCNFMIPGSINKAAALGNLKIQPSISCRDSLDRGYNALFTVLTALLGLKAKLDD